jgi:outer membrane receptor protein involved in Fe transport
MKRCGQFLAFVALMLFSTGAALTQSSTGTINGTVTDRSGAAISGAAVTLTDVDTGELRHAITTATGTYSFEFLPPAVYSVAVKAEGFASYLQNAIKLDVASAVSVSPKLNIGSQTSTVSVTDEAPLLETETSSIGYEIDQKTITDLPTDGRNVYGLATLVPGVIAPPAFTQVSTGMYNEQFVSINGSRSNQSLFLLDGGTNSNSAFYGPTLYPSIDSVQEFKVQTNNYSAEYSNAAGGVVNVITKSGTETYHGSLFEFLRNNDLDANYFFNNRYNVPLGPYKFNQFGAAVGGPVRIPHIYDPVKNKLFFYFSYEGLRWIQITNTSAIVPTALEHQGDFSQTYAPNGQLQVIYDPATVHPDPDPTDPGGFIRDPFPGNKIPQSRWDPVAANILSYYPLPNVGGTGLIAGQNNFYESQSGLTSKDTGSFRLDYAISDTQRIFGRYAENVSVIHRPNPFLGSTAPAGPSIGDDRLLQYQDVIDYTNTLSPHTVLELNTSFNRYPLYRTPPGYGFNPTQVGMPSYFNELNSTLPPCFPEIGAAGYIGVGVCGELVNIMNAYQEVANVIRTYHSHTFKFGLIFSTNQQDTRANVDAQANLNFGTAQTAQNTNVYSPTSGNAMASFLVGFGNGGQIVSGQPPIFVITKHWGGYFQDDWQFRRDLTFNLGLRYDVNTPYTERHNRMTDLTLTAQSPLQVPGLDLKGGFEYPGTDGLSRYVSNVDFHDVQPRLGFSYAVSPKLVVRGGGGLFMGPIIGSGTPQDGYYSSTQWVASLDGGIHEEYPLSNPFPQGFVLPTGNSLGLATLLGQGGTGIRRNQKTSYSEQWNLDTQYALPGNLLLDVAYAGSAGMHLYYFQVLNQLPDNLMSMGTALQQQVPNPFYGKVSIGSLSQPTISREQLLLPYPQFTFLNSNTSEGNSIYHALQVVLKRNFQKGFSFQISYTYGKLIDDMDGFGAWTGPADGGNIQDWDNPKAERAPAIFDVTHHVVANWVYELPFGRGKPFVHERLASAIVGGWQLNGIGTFQGGVPLQMGTITNTLDNNGGAQRPNRVPGVSPYEHGAMYQRINQYFNPAAYTAPPAFTYGNIARSLGYLRGPGIANWDLSVFRNIHLYDRLGLQLRAEAFNAFNRTQFGIPDTTIGDPAAGTITSQANDPRTIQIAAKLTF